MADEDPIDVVERAMVGLRRSIAKRTLSRRVQATLAVDPQHLAVLDAVAFGAEGGEVVTVGAVAEKLAVDPSRASRMVAGAVDAGLLRRVAAQRDGRRVALELTPQGEALKEAINQVRRDWFADALADFTPEERAQFAELLTRFLAGLDR